MRLIVDRPQMVLQVLSGQGRVANDMYSPLDAGYNHSLPQRHQDIEQAKSLLKQAGHEGLTVQLVTSPVFNGRRAGGRGVRPAGARRRRQGQPQPGQHQRLLRPQLPQVDVRPGLLGDARVPAAGGAGSAPAAPFNESSLAAEERPGHAVHQADRAGDGRAEHRPSGTSCCTRPRRSSTRSAGTSSPTSPTRSTPTAGRWAASSRRHRASRWATTGSRTSGTWRHEQARGEGDALDDPIPDQAASCWGS